LKSFSFDANLSQHPRSFLNKCVYDVKKKFSHFVATLFYVFSCSRSSSFGIGVVLVVNHCARVHNPKQQQHRMEIRPSSYIHIYFSRSFFFSFFLFRFKLFFPFFVLLGLYVIFLSSPPPLLPFYSTLFFHGGVGNAFPFSEEIGSKI
jgi:hypothetical protein